MFFFSVGETYKPIGFIETASPVVSMEWSKKLKVNNRFLSNMYYFIAFVHNFTYYFSYPFHLLPVRGRLYFRKHGVHRLISN